MGKTKFYLGLELEYKANGMLVHQSIYIERVLKHFHINKVHLLSTPMVVRSLETQNDSFWPKKLDEEILDPKVPYFNTIRTLMYMT